MQYEVIIVGGGMAGLSCALGLAQNGFKVAVIEAKKIIKTFELDASIKRVSAINEASQTLLKQLEIWQNVADVRINDYVAMHILDQNSSAKLELKAIECSLISLGAIVENDLIVAKLYQQLKKLDVCIFEEAHIIEITQSAYTNTLRLTGEKVLECQLIVGADGANSFIREYFGFSCKTKAYQHHAIVANVKTAKPHQNTAYQRFLRHGILALLPLSKSDLCSIVYSVEPQKLSHVLAMKDEAFGEHLTIASEAVLGELKVQSARMSFELIERHVEQYAQPGVVLIADAAHTIHPLAGQGINLGFADVRALIEVLAEAKRLRRNIADMSTLTKYAHKRRFENQLMMEMMRDLKQLFCNDNMWLRSLRALGMNAVNKNRLLKRFFIEKAEGL